MKRQLEYSTLLSIATEISKHIKEHIDQPKLFSVMRGGMSLAHIVGYQLALPVGAYYPKLQRLMHPELMFRPQDFDDTYVFLEDVLATGRTLQAIREFMADRKSQWQFYPAVIDASLPYQSQVTYGTALVTNDWMVFPHENFDKVVEGDHGLFREGTSENSKEQL